MKPFTFLIFILLTLNTTAFAQKVTEKDGIALSNKEFPWELVIDRGKIVGCIYDNKYYSLGSILIEENLPRKCQLNSAREGVWAELSGSELADFHEQEKKKQELEIEKTKLLNESNLVGGKPLTTEEAFLIRYLRKMIKKNAESEGKAQP